MPTKSEPPKPTGQEYSSGSSAVAVISLPGPGGAAPIGDGCCAVAPHDAVRAELETLPGIAVETIDRAAGTVIVAIDPENPDALHEATEALAELGFANIQITWAS